MVDKKVVIRKRKAIQGVRERTRIRRGRAPTVEDMFTPEVPTPPPVVQPPPPPTKATKPPPPPPPPPPLIPFAQVGNTKFNSKAEFEKAKKINSPCGDSAPFAVNRSTGEQFCTFGDFSDAGFKLPKPLPRNTRGKLCPPGETYWGTKCRKISFSESTFL